jgi:hypothetical protein
MLLLWASTILTETGRLLVLGFFLSQVSNFFIIDMRKMSMNNDIKRIDPDLDDDGSDIGADDWAQPDPMDMDDVPVFDRGHTDISPDSLFDDPDKYTWG